MTTRISINGKFLLASPTGVHRSAEELIKSIDKSLLDNPDKYKDVSVELLVPRNVRRQLNLEKIRTRTCGIFSQRLWEQFDFPLASRSSVMLNLCNLGPVVSRNAVTLIHDAQVYSSPTSYSLPFRAWYKMLQPMIGRRHRSILTVSGFSKGELVKYGVAREHKISVVYNGADQMRSFPSSSAPVSSLGLQEDGYVLALSSVQDHKNIKLLLQAFSDPAMRHMTLALYGSSGKKDFESRGLRVPDNVVFTGRVSDETLRTLLENAVCLAFPSTTEGFGLPPLEAMVVGCPVIVSRCGALPEVCNEAAIYASESNAQDWVREITRVWNDQGLRQDLIDAGKDNSKLYSWDESSQKILGHLMELGT